MKRWSIVMGGLVVVGAMLVWGCGGGSSSSDPASSGGTSAPDAALTGLAKVVDGSWAGSWKNLSFGSTGDITADMAVSGTELHSTVDVDGMVFGLLNPKSEDLIAAMTSGGGTITFVVTSDTAGKVTITVKVNAAGGYDFSAEGADVPQTGIKSFSASGTISSTTATGLSTIKFSGGGSAQASFTVTKG